MGHPILTSFLAIADGEAIGRVKFEMTEVTTYAIYPFFGGADLVLAYATTLRTAAEEGR